MRWWAAGVAAGLSVVIGAGPGLADPGHEPTRATGHGAEITVGDGEVLWFVDPRADAGYVAEQPAAPAGAETVVTVVYDVDVNVHGAPPRRTWESPAEAAYRHEVEQKMQRKLAKIRAKDALRRYKLAVVMAKLDYKQAAVGYELDQERWELADEYGWEALGREAPADGRRPIQPRWEDFEPPAFSEAAYAPARPAPPAITRAPQGVAPGADGPRLVIDWPDGQRTQVPLD